MAGVCYIEYTNQAPLIGWALANVYLINHDELNALHTLDKLIELMHRNRSYKPKP